MHRWTKYFNSKLFVVLLLLLFSVALSAVMSLSKSVEHQSLLEQKSLTPVFDLVTQEIMNPLFIAETIARASSLKLSMNESVIDQNKITSKLDEISKEFGMDFFVASEKSRTQYNSNGTTFPLTIDTVEWYFRAKEADQNIVGTLGNRADIHFYFDIKVHNEAGEFLGFIGVSKRLQSFVSTFEHFKKQFGYEFIFVDQNDKIILSSDSSVIADGKRIMHLSLLPWFKGLMENKRAGNSLNNLLVNVEGEDLLIARVDLKALNWKLYLVNSLEVRQNDSAKSFILQAVNIMFLLLVTLVIGYTILPFILDEFARKHQKDPLTQLPNRANLSWCFKQMAKSELYLSAIIVDIDFFKNVNDTYGHAAGDAVLKEVALLLKSQSRNVDVVSRWGGEEFVILLPATNIKTANEIAERARVAISQHNFLADQHNLNITASMGVASRLASCKLDDLVISADDALYKAKREGRNTVRASDGQTMTNHFEQLSHR